MEPEKFRKLISVMIMSIMVGGIHDRMKYLGTVIDHLNYYVRTEKVAKNRAMVLNTRAQVIEAFNYIVSRSREKLKINEEQDQRIRQQFARSHITLDASWGTPESHVAAQTFKELEALVTARVFYYRAVDAYSRFLTGNPDGLTEATIQAGNAMGIIMNICYDNDFIEIGEGEWRKALAAQPTPHPIPADTVTRR